MLHNYNTNLVISLKYQLCNYRKTCKASLKLHQIIMRFIKILLLLQLILSLNSCGPLSYKKTDARKFPADPDERVKKNMEEGKGFKLFDSERKVGYNL